ncbi:hypothetical protein DMB92_08570 [Campylobacter sp. MIT 99-7217]|nr:hypothetical protein DMB92_08570 [Campylobacter sp. MIT 99-7217]
MIFSHFYLSCGIITLNRLQDVSGKVIYSLSLKIKQIFQALSFTTTFLNFKIFISKPLKVIFFPPTQTTFKKNLFMIQFF